MKFDLTKHALDVIFERNISIDFIEKVLNNPELIEPDANDVELQHYLSKIHEYDNRVMRVIINKKSCHLKFSGLLYNKWLTIIQSAST